MEKAEFSMVEFATSVTATKPVEKKTNNGTTNVLSGSQESEEMDFEELESYEPTDKIDCEAATVKESMEKKGKRKRRNYLEFRPDYEKD
ncbi:MAG: hypothetical protein ACXAAO_03035 [Candidatus Thorarchaeota archaeon]|jgi:hypothetical protein